MASPEDDPNEDDPNEVPALEDDAVVCGVVASEPETVIAPEVDDEGFVAPMVLLVLLSSTVLSPTAGWQPSDDAMAITGNNTRSPARGSVTSRRRVFIERDGIPR